MSFIHDAADFDDLLRIVASGRGIAPCLVEKDYWVTHALWALHHQGFDVWFKGGTSLSKGFGLIERFSEDLDLKVEPGKTIMPLVTNWKGEGTTAVSGRRASFKSLADLFVVPGAPVTMDPQPPDRLWRGVKLLARRWNGASFRSSIPTTLQQYCRYADTKRAAIPAREATRSATPAGSSSTWTGAAGRSIRAASTSLRRARGCGCTFS